MVWNQCRFSNMGFNVICRRRSDSTRPCAGFRIFQYSPSLDIKQVGGLMYMLRSWLLAFKWASEMSTVASFNFEMTAIEKTVRIKGNWAVQESIRISSLSSSLLPWGTIRNFSLRFPVLPLYFTFNKWWSTIFVGYGILYRGKIWTKTISLAYSFFSAFSNIQNGANRSFAYDTRLPAMMNLILFSISSSQNSIERG